MWSVADTASQHEMCQQHFGILTKSVMISLIIPAPVKRKRAVLVSMQCFWEGKNVPCFHHLPQDIQIHWSYLQNFSSASLSSKPPLLQHDDNLVLPTILKTPTNKQNHIEDHIAEQYRKGLGSISKSSYKNRSPNYILIWIIEISIHPP